MVLTEGEMLPLGPRVLGAHVCGRGADPRVAATCAPTGPRSIPEHPRLTALGPDEVIEHPPTRVLLVEDAEDIRFLFRVVLQSDPGFEVWGEAENGAEAIALLATGCPDVILLDIMMPVMDGLTALPLLRELCPAAPVVVMTAAATPQVRLDAVGHGAYAVIEKGAEIDEIKQMLSIACSRPSTS